MAQTNLVLGAAKPWKPSRADHKRAIEIVKNQIASIERERRKVRIQIAEANRRIAAAGAKEVERLGINTARIESVYKAEAARAEAEMKKYRRMKVQRPSISRHFGTGKFRNFAPNNGISQVCTPPFPSIGTIPPTSNPPGTVAFPTTSPAGTMSYFLDTPITAPAPSNVTTGALVGCPFTPTLGSFPNIFYGSASVQMSGSLFMITRLSANGWWIFGGNAHSEGSVGWIVVQFAPNGDTQIAQQTYQDMYYLDVGPGQSNGAQINNPSFTSQTTFVTAPLCSYDIFVWLQGNIEAEGAQPLSFTSSQAAGSGSLFVESIALQWVPWTWFI